MLSTQDICSIVNPAQRVVGLGVNDKSGHMLHLDGAACRAAHAGNCWDALATPTPSADGKIHEKGMCYLQGVQISHKTTAHQIVNPVAQDSTCAPVYARSLDGYVCTPACGAPPTMKCPTPTYRLTVSLTDTGDCRSTPMPIPRPVLRQRKDHVLRAQELRERRAAGPAGRRPPPSPWRRAAPPPEAAREAMRALVPNIDSKNYSVQQRACPRRALTRERYAEPTWTIDVCAPSSRLRRRLSCPPRVPAEVLASLRTSISVLAQAALRGGPPTPGRARRRSRAPCAAKTPPILTCACPPPTLQAQCSAPPCWHPGRVPTRPRLRPRAADATVPSIVDSVSAQHLDRLNREDAAAGCVLPAPRRSRSTTARRAGAAPGEIRTDRVSQVKLFPSETLVLWTNQHPPLSLPNLKESDVYPYLGKTLDKTTPALRQAAQAEVHSAGHVPYGRTRR